MEKIIIKDAFENNLKHLDLEIPLDKFTCVTLEKRTAKKLSES